MAMKVWKLNLVRCLLQSDFMLEIPATMTTRQCAAYGISHIGEIIWVHLCRTMVSIVPFTALMLETSIYWIHAYFTILFPLYRSWPFMFVSFICKHDGANVCCQSPMSERVIHMRSSICCHHETNVLFCMFGMAVNWNQNMYESTILHIIADINVCLRMCTANVESFEGGVDYWSKNTKGGVYY